MPAHEYLTNAQIETLLFSCSPGTEKTLIQLGLILGCRVSEIVSIRLSEIEYCKFVIWDEKKDRHRTVVCDASTYHQVRDYIEHDLIEQPYVRKNELRLFPFTTKTANNILKRVCVKAGIPAKMAHWHILRHTYVVQSLDKGIPINHIIEQTGDAPSTILRVYGIPSIESRVKMIEERPIWRKVVQ